MVRSGNGVTPTQSTVNRLKESSLRIELLSLSLSPFSPSFLSIIAILVIYRRYERVLFLQFVILNPFFSFLSGQYPALLHSMMLERREKRI